MNGLKPEDIEHLKQLQGNSVTQIGVGQFDIQFAVHPGDKSPVSVRGRCELLDDTGAIVDVWEDGKRSDRFRFFELLGKEITDVSIDSPRSFVMTFQGGLRLRIIDNSDQHESFSVGNMYV